MRPMLAHLYWIVWRTLRGPVWLFYGYLALYLKMSEGDSGENRVAFMAIAAYVGQLGVVVDASRAVQAFGNRRRRAVFAMAPMSAASRAAAETVVPLLFWWGPVLAVYGWLWFGTGAAPQGTWLAYWGITAVIALWAQSWFRSPAVGAALAIASLLVPFDFVYTVPLAVCVAAVFGLDRWRRSREGHDRFRQANARPGTEVHPALMNAVTISAVGLSAGALTAGALLIYTPIKPIGAAYMGMGSATALLSVMGVLVAHWPRPVDGSAGARDAARAWNRLPVARDQLIVVTVRRAATAFGVAVLGCFALWSIPADLLYPTRDADVMAMVDWPFMRILLFAWPLVCGSSVFYLWSRTPRSQPARRLLKLAWAASPVVVFAGFSARLYLGYTFGSPDTPPLYVVIAALDFLFPWWSIVLVWIVSVTFLVWQVSSERHRRGPVPNV